MSAYQPTKRHPLALTLIVAGHGAVLAALMLSKMEVPAIKRIIAEHIDAPKPPPPPPVEIQPKTEAKPSQTESVIDRSPLPIPSPNPLPPAPPTPAPPPIPLPQVPTGDVTVLPPPPAPAPLPLPPTPAPVRVDAERDPRAEFQPPYPDSLRAQGEEGRAIVRVRVGTDGRVKAAEEVSATHPAFMAATVRHARARWRFRPATVDGKPVESWKRVTVTFTLND